MAYRIRNFDNLSVDQVNDIFRRGRGLGREVASAREGEDFTLNPLSHRRWRRLNHPDISMPPAEVVDDELESVI